jgi:hypothetical protein
MFLFIFISIQVKSQLSLQWERQYGGSLVESMSCSDFGTSNVIQTFDGGFIIGGRSESDDGNISTHHGLTQIDDIWIIKTDSTGNIKWEKSLGGSGVDQLGKIRQTSDSGIIIIGTTASFDGDITHFYGNYDIWVAKLDSLGNILWQKNYGGSLYDGGTDIHETTNGYVFCGVTNSNDNDVTGLHGNEDFWVVKINSIGNIQWQKTFGGSNIDYATSLTEDAFGNYFVAGSTYSAHEDFLIIKVDNSGNLIWQKSFGGTGSDVANSICKLANNEFAITGYSSSLNGNISGHHGNLLNDYWVIKIDSAGNLLWQKSLGGTFEDRAYDVYRTHDNGILITGVSDSKNGDVLDHISTPSSTSLDNFWIVKLDSLSNIIWTKSFSADSSGGSKGFSSLETSLDCYAFAGDGAGGTNHHGSTDFWLVKACNSTNNINVIHSLQEIELFPNPIYEFVTIKTEKVNMKYEIRNTLCKLIKTGILESFETNLSMNNFKSGIYILSIFSDKEVSRFPIIIQ